MSVFDIIAVLIGLSAAFGVLNHLYLRLPHTIGLVVIALAASVTVVVIDLLVPAIEVGRTITSLLREIDFNKALMEGMLSFLLFAGALHVDFAELASRKWAIATLATVGVLTSTFIIGSALWFILGILGLGIPFIYALVFGALISPTDPVAVLSILKSVIVPKPLEAKIAGESLFNDGVGVVVFTIVAAIAAGGGQDSGGAGGVALLFVQEALGGALLGGAAGYVAFRAMRAIDEYNLEILITLALVMVTYSVAHFIHVSGPIAIVVAGLFIGNHGVKFAMSDKTRVYVQEFWALIDEILNSVLFLLIGLEVLVVGFDADYVKVALVAIPLVLAARWISVALPISLLAIRSTFTTGAIPVLTWGGLRGGISVALALSLPESGSKGLILAATYGVVIFSIVVQGLTIKKVVEKAVR